MNNITELVNLLQNRLPELEWKLSNLNIPLTTKIMPPSLFKWKTDLSARSCIDEIRSDLKNIKRQTSETSALYLASLVSRKIHVLTNLCKQPTYKRAANETKIKFSVQTIGNRQEWLEDLRATMQTLSKQQTALQHRLELLKNRQDLNAKLNAQAELGEITKLLTEARETMQKVEAQGYV